jgi:3,4-dihydroxy 2-butanone 4-phosphate synthase/GTP cyclohydrolase II
MARLPDLVEFGKAHGLKIGAIRDLIEYRAATEHLIEKVCEKAVDTAHGRFTLSAFEDKTSGDVHFALSRGDIAPERETLVRVHEPISVVDFLDPSSNHHSFPVNDSLAALAAAEAGVIVLLYRSMSGRELLASLNGTRDRPAKWDPRLFGVGAQILRALDVGKMRLLANPRKIPSMAGFGLEITGFVTN